jgi:hypothetical protein
MSKQMMIVDSAFLKKKYKTDIAKLSTKIIALLKVEPLNSREKTTKKQL